MIPRGLMLFGQHGVASKAVPGHALNLAVYGLSMFVQGLSRSAMACAGALATGRRLQWSAGMMLCCVHVIMYLYR